MDHTGAACDSQITAGSTIEYLHPTQAKIVQWDGVLLAIAGRASALTHMHRVAPNMPKRQRVRWWHLPRKREWLTSDQYFVSYAAEVGRWAFQESSSATGDPNDEPGFESSMLVWVEGRVYSFGAGMDDSPQRVVGPVAIGSGSYHAMGALSQGASLVEAVQVAIKHDAYSGGDVIAYDVG